MTDQPDRADKQAPEDTPAGAAEDYVTVREAQELLGVSKVKMTQLIHDGVVQTYESVLDKRVKLVRRTDVERLARTLRPRKKLAPVA